MLHDEGYVKFSVRFQQEPLGVPVPGALLTVRDTLHQMGLIGVYPDGIGFGNVSMRVPGTDTFLITGTQTGSVFPISETEVALVTRADIPANTVYCRGAVAASSESMTHAACYFRRRDIGMVIHVHHSGLWQTLMHRVPTTPMSITYGTPEMADAIGAVCASGGDSGLIVAAGHQDGIFVYGIHADSALTALLRYYETWSANRG